MNTCEVAPMMDVIFDQCLFDFQHAMHMVSYLCSIVNIVPTMRCFVLRVWDRQDNRQAYSGVSMGVQ